MNKILLLHIITDLDMTNNDEIHILHLTDRLIDHRIDAIPVLDVDHVQIRGINQLNNTLLHLNLNQGEETLDH